MVWIRGKYNNNGTIVDASILQNGTTYIPIRMVSDMLGVPIEWEGSTRSVLIGNKSMVETTDLLGLSATDIVKSNRYDRVDIDNHIWINGKNHRGLALHSAWGETLSVKYNLNRAYKEFSTTLWADQTVYVMIVGDGIPLWQGHVLSSSNPVDVNISTKNVSELEFRIEDEMGFSRTAYFINPLLSK